MERRERTRRNALRPLTYTDAPDGSGICLPDGSGLLYTTHPHGDPGPNIQVWRVNDWVKSPATYVGPALAEQPAWGKRSTQFWAPSPPIRWRNRWLMAYSTDPDERRNGTLSMGIAVAFSDRPVPDGGFVPAPEYTHAGDGFSVIDPHLQVVDGELYMYYGSMEKPICCQKMAEDGFRFAPGSQPMAVMRPEKRKFESLIEGFYLAYHRELRVWIAFVAGHSALGEWDEYAATAFWSNSPFGPFERIGIVVGPSENGWWAPGQVCVVEMPDGSWDIVCHAVDPREPYIEGTRHFRRIACHGRLGFTKAGPRLI